MSDESIIKAMHDKLDPIVSKIALAIADAMHDTLSRYKDKLSQQEATTVCVKAATELAAVAAHAGSMPPQMFITAALASMQGSYGDSVGVQMVQMPNDESEITCDRTMFGNKPIMGNA